MKKYCEREAECLKGLTEDASLQGFAPTFHGIVNLAEEKYTRMQDLLLPFDNPSLMDCKMGIRFETFCVIFFFFVFQSYFRDCNVVSL